ncbi:MAG: glycosyltransferase family 39 protein [Methanomassiliicoccaceae archaeon]|nr:glycosyltransferase family 39 protein [Methanomassiliicoccaceae archaeon]
MITDPALNYPFGGLNHSPPLFDWSVAMLAYPLTLFGYSVSEAASAALVFSTAIVGALTCIPVYLLAREMFSRRIAIVAAAFFAISAVAIVQTVFSNGTESAYFVFFFVLMTLFLLRAVKAFKPADEASVKKAFLAPFKDKAVFRNTLFATLSLTALMLSWIGFLSVITIISFIMLVQAVLDRLRGKSAMGMVAVYGFVMVVALLISSLYYALVMGMYTLVAGPLVLALLIIIISVLVSYHRVWVITFPVSLAIAIVTLTAIAFMAPSLYAAMTSGFYPYADGKFGSLVGAYSSVTLSTQAIYAGVVTMWFAFIVAAYRLFDLPKNADSKPYMFITMWFVAMLYMSWRNIDLAYLAAPMYAIGAGVVIVWVLRRVHIKDYVAAFKGCSLRTIWRKILRPVPLITVLATVFVLLMPNMLYAVDASIPSNEKANYNADMHLGSPDSDSINYLGATNYYIKDNNWNLSTAWDTYAGKDKDGALVTWLDYGAEAAAKGNFQVVADHFGNGVSAASNILLGTPSEAIASMTVRLMLVESRQFWATAGVDENLLRIVYDGKVPTSFEPDVSNIDYVRMNPDTFGPTDYDVSEENAMYFVASHYLTSAFTDGEIAALYNKVIDETGNKIGYVGVTGSMLPLYFGDNSLFSTMAYLNDYYLDSNAAPSKYFWAGIPYFGYYYYYNDIMYETMLWRALVGMSLEDYKALHNDPSLSFSTLMRGLMLSDGTYKAYPGFGLSNFTVDEWWVMYNPENDASGDWVLLNGTEAQARQAADGGLINYLGGISFLKYEADCELFEGTVVTPDCTVCAGCVAGTGCTENKVNGMTVSFYDPNDPDEEGNPKLIGITITDENGRYSMMIPVNDSKGDPRDMTALEIRLHSGSVYAMEVVIGSLSDVLDANPTIEIVMADLVGLIVGLPSYTPVETVREIEIKMAGSRSGKEYSFNPNDLFEFEHSLVPDVYTVVMSLKGADIYTGTFTLYSGDMDVGEINVRTVAVAVTVRDRFSALIPDASVDIIDKNGEIVGSAITDDRGVARTNVAPGNYTVQLTDYEYGVPAQTWMLVSSSSTTMSTAFTARLGSASNLSVIMVEAVEVTINGVEEGDVITLTNGAYSWMGAYTAVVVAESTTATVHVPVGDYGDASGYSATRMIPGDLGRDTTLDVETVGSSVTFTTVIDVEVITSVTGAAEIEITNNTSATLYVSLTSDITFADSTGPIKGLIAVPGSSSVVIDATWGTGTDLEIEIAVFDEPHYSKVSKLNTVSTWLAGEQRIDITMVDTAAKDKAAAGVVSFIRSDGLIITIPMGVPEDSSVTTFTTYLPEGDYTVYAYATSLVKKAYIGTLTVDGGDAISLNIELLDAIIGRGEVRYVATTTTSKVAFVPVVVTTTIDGKVHKVILSTDALGVYYMMIPRNGGTTVGSSYNSNTERLFGHTPTMDARFMAPTNAAVLASTANATDQTGRNITVWPVGIEDTFVMPKTSAGGSFDVDDDGTTVTVGDMDISISVVTTGTDAVSQIAITNTSTADLWVALRAQDDDMKLRVGATGTPAGEVITRILQGATTTVSAFYDDTVSFDPEVLVTVTLRVDVSQIGDIFDVTVTQTAEGRATINLANKTGATQYVVLRSSDVAFTDSTDFSNAVNDYTNSVPSSGRTLRAVFDPFVTDVTIEVTASPHGSVKVDGITVIDDFDAIYNEVDTSETVLNADHSREWFMDLYGTKDLAIDVNVVIGPAMELKNYTDTKLYVTLEAEYVSFSNTSSGGWKDKFTTIVPAAKDGEPGTKTVHFRTGTTPPNTDIDVTVVVADVIVTVNGEPVNPLDPYMLIRSGSHALVVEPASSVAGTVGPYFGGNVTLFAGQVEIDALEKATNVMVLHITTEDKDDKVTFKNMTVRDFDTARNATSTDKRYYVVLDENDEFSGTVIVESKDGKRIAYADVDDISAASEIDMSEYGGEKITVSGYVGRIADGEMTITMTAGTLTGTSVVPISKGEYEASLPKMMDGVAIVYEFSARVNDQAKGAFTEIWTVPDIEDILNDDGKAVVNMEVGLEPVTFAAFAVDGTVSAYGKPLSGVTITYTVDGKEFTVTTNSGGYYLITTTGTEIEITDVTMEGYELTTALPAPPITTSATFDFEMDPSVVIDVTGTVFEAGVNTMAKVTFTMDVTNNHGSTVVLVPNKSWSMPMFSVGGAGATNYAVIPNDGTTHSVVMVAYYDTSKVGAGSDQLSLAVRDLLGDTLQMKALDTMDPAKEGSLTEDDTSTNGNRISKNEYGFAATFSNDKDEWVELDLWVDIPAGMDDDWFVSIVDADNVVLAKGTDVATITIPGKAVVTYYVRLISINEVQSDAPQPSGLEMNFSSTTASGTVSGTILMEEIMTNLSVTNQTASGNNLFSSLNGMPDIVWALIALILLAALLVFWLGMRRGVFSRKR